jgi:hypothetical protein
MNVASTALRPASHWLICSLIFILSMLPGSNTYAVELTDLYSGDVLVGEQAPSESRLVQQAFLAMLVKLTGNDNPLSLPGVSGSLGDASRLVIRQGYVPYDPPALLRDLQTTVTGEPAVRLFRARFAANQVDQWLQRRQLRRWSPERRAISLWLVYEQDFQRQLVMDHEDPLRWLAQQTADTRGLPLDWPQPLRFLGNEEDLQNAISDVWGGFPENLPSAREPVLLAAAQVNGDVWQVRWRYFSNGQFTRFNTQGLNLANAFQEGIGQAAEFSAQQASIVTANDEQQQLRLTVHGVNSASDYGRVINELENLSQTENLQVSRAEGSTLFIVLTARAGREWLQRALALNQILEVRPGSLSASTIALELQP